GMRALDPAAILKRRPLARSTTLRRRAAVADFFAAPVSSSTATVPVQPKTLIAGQLTGTFTTPLGFAVRAVTGASAAATGTGDPFDVAPLPSTVPDASLDAGAELGAWSGVEV